MEYLVHFLLEPFGGRFRAKAEVEQGFETAGNDIIGAGPGVDVGNLKRRGRKKLVTGIECSGTKCGQRRHYFMDWIVGALRIGGVTLLSNHCQAPV